MSVKPEVRDTGYAAGDSDCNSANPGLGAKRSNWTWKTRQGLTKSLCLAAVMSVWPSQVIAQENALIQLERHKPLYFLMGRPHTKIQISFKIGLIQRVPIYLGYTQLLIGDLFVADPGFRDVNYNPEIFYRLSLPLADHWIDFSPYEHESNGKGGVL